MDPERAKDTLIRQRVLVGVSSNFLGQLVTYGILFFLTPFILHRLEAANYGLWVLVGSVVAYGSLLDFGIWGAIIKYVAEYRARQEVEQARALVATALWLYVFFGLIIATLSVVLAPVIPHLFGIPDGQRHLATQLVRLMGLGIGVSLPGMTPLAVLRGLQRYDVVALVDIAAALFTALATVTVLLLGGGLLELAAANISGIFVMLGLGTWSVHRIAPELRFGFRGAQRRLARLVLSYSWPLFVKDVATRLQTKTDEITIGVFLPVLAIAPYNIARRLSEATGILTQQFMKVLLPLASELHAENDTARLRQLYTSGSRLALAISLSIGCILIVFAGPVLALWVGPAYTGAASLVVILTLAGLFAAAQWPAGAVLRGMARHRLLAATSLGSGLANLALSIALIRPLGLAGVALGTLIPNVIETAIILPYTMRIIGVSAAKAVKEIFLPALAPAVLMVLVCVTLRQVLEPSSLPSILIASAIGLASYGIAYLLVGASQAERQAFRQACRGIAFNLYRVARGWLKPPG